MERGGFGSPLGSLRAAEGGKSGIGLGRLFMGTREYIVLGFSLGCGLWWLSFPNSVIRFYRALYGSRFSPRPFFIRLGGGVWIVAALWIFWPIISK